MTKLGALLSVLAIGASAIACSAAPEQASQSEEALRPVNGGGGDGTGGGGTTSRYCTNVNTACSIKQLGWSSLDGDAQRLAWFGCSQVYWWSDFPYSNYMALCPKNANVDEWVAEHPGNADESAACDSCVQRPPAGWVWVSWMHLQQGPYCPSGCGVVVW